MKSPVVVLALLATVPSCTEPDEPEPPVAAPVAVFGPGACQAVGAPPARAWDGVGRVVPGGAATLVIMGDAFDESMIDAYLIEGPGGAVCDHVQLSRAKVGDLVQVTLAVNEDLTLVGSTLRPLPPPPPPPGQDLVANSYARYVTMTSEWARAWASELAIESPLPFP